MVDAFGTELFSSLWGIVTTGGLVTVKIFSKLLSMDLDKDNCEALGNKCVLRTFSTTYCLALLGLAATGCMIFIKFQREKKESASITILIFINLFKRRNKVKV